MSVTKNLKLQTFDATEDPEFTEWARQQNGTGFSQASNAEKIDEAIGNLTATFKWIEDKQVYISVEDKTDYTCENAESLRLLFDYHYLKQGFICSINANFTKDGVVAWSLINKFRDIPVILLDGGKKVNEITFTAKTAREFLIEYNGFALVIQSISYSV